MRSLLPHCVFKIEFQFDGRMKGRLKKDEKVYEELLVENPRRGKLAC
jgi:hypothetical protein